MVRLTPEALLVPDGQRTQQARDPGKTYISSVRVTALLPHTFLYPTCHIEAIPTIAHPHIRAWTPLPNNQLKV